MKGDFKMGFNFTCPYCQTKTTINSDKLVEQEVKMRVVKGQQYL